MDIHEPLGLALLASIGLVAGTINTIAGGGSLITLPALMLLGLPPQVANATNRVGVVLQASVATVSFARAGQLELTSIWPRLIACLTGALGGAALSVVLEPGVFRRVIAVAMLLLLVILVAPPKRLLKEKRAAPIWAQIFGFVIIGTYGGFLQAGVGLFILTGSTLLIGEDLVRGNATKNFLVAALNVPALGLFICEGLVAPGPGFALASGMMVGGVVGSRLALLLGASFVRTILVVVVVVAASRLLGLW